MYDVQLRPLRAGSCKRAPEQEAGDWLIRCLACGARNIVPVFKLVGWR
jgi:hypothetical protein